MSLKNRFFSFLTVALGVVVFSTFTIAQETTTPLSTDKNAEKRASKMGGKAHGKRGGHMRGGHMPGGKMHGLRGITLSDAQKAQIKSIRDSNRPDEATRTELKAIREAHKAGSTITPEQKERVKFLREQRRAKAQIVREQIQAILTPEQKAQIEAQRLEMRQRFEQRKQRKAPAATPAIEG